MPGSYNPIVRTFNELRAGLTAALGLPRHAVHPATEVAELVPAGQRRRVWRQLRARGLRLPSLVLSSQVRRAGLLALATTAVSVALCLRLDAGVRLDIGLCVVVPLGLVAYLLSRPCAVHLPYGLRTVEELVLYAVDFRRHKDSGYRWTHNEIALKVRLVLAECLDVALEEVQPEKTLTELGER
jgi:hypothetical protein